MAWNDEDEAEAAWRESETMRAEAEQQWSVDEECASHGHEYYGDHEGVGRCYCGWKHDYPLGGPVKP